MSQFVTAAELRTYLDTTKTDGRYAGTHLDFLIQSASDQLERATGRLITASASNTVKTFTTHGRALITVPDLRSVATVTLGGSTLTEGETFHPIPSAQANDIYTGIQVRTFRGPWTSTNWYLAYPEWFDRNLDSPLYGTRGDTSLPNDLVVTGLWGWANPPSVWKLATLALAGYYIKHGDALLSGAAQTPEGAVLDYSQFPSEVQRLIMDWKLGEQVVLV